MFLLTEATLFFFNLTLNDRIREEKPSLSSVVQAWVDGVAASSVDSADTTMNAGEGSTSYAIHRSPTSGGREVVGASTSQNAPVSSKAGETAMGHCGEASASTSGMVVVRFPPYRLRSLPDSLRQQEVPRVVKRKVDDMDMEPDGNGDDDLVLEDIRVGKMGSSTASKRGRMHTPSTVSLCTTYTICLSLLDMRRDSQVATPEEGQT